MEKHQYICPKCGCLYRQTGGEGWDLLDFLSGH